MHELPGTHGDGGGARDPGSMDVDADTLDPLGEPAEVGEARGPDRELVETEEPVEKDDGMTWPDPAARPAHAPQPTATAKPEESADGSEADGGSDHGEDFDAHEGTPPFRRPIASAACSVGRFRIHPRRWRSVSDAPAALLCPPPLIGGREENPKRAALIRFAARVRLLA